MRSFPDISSLAYEHPTDRAALVALRKVRGFDLIVKQLFGALPERRLRLLYLANAVKVGDRQLPELHGQLAEVCEVLDVEPPELFVVSNPHANAMAVGIDAPFIVLNSSLLRTMDDDEIRCVLAHEVAHVLSGHVLYKTMLVLLESAMRWFLRGPLILPSLPVLLALKEWDRKSELSADRGSLLVAQDVELVRRVMIKLAGGSGEEPYNIEEFERQAEAYRESAGIVDRFFKVMNLLYMSHPFPVLRVSEIGRFAESEEYSAILDGEYPRRSDPDVDRDVSGRVREAAAQLRDDVDSGFEPVSDLARSVGSLGRDVFTTLFGAREPSTSASREAEEEQQDPTR